MKTCICRQPASLRCSVCKAAWYCGPTCQRADWKNHKLGCKAPQKLIPVELIKAAVHLLGAGFLKCQGTAQDHAESWRLILSHRNSIDQLSKCEARFLQVLDQEIKNINPNRLVTPQIRLQLLQLVMAAVCREFDQLQGRGCSMESLQAMLFKCASHILPMLDPTLPPGCDQVWIGQQWIRIQPRLPTLLALLDPLLAADLQ